MPPSSATACGIDYSALLPTVLGRQVRIDNDVYVIVGVLPSDFRHPAPASEKAIELWATAGFRAAPFPGPVRNARILPNIIGRLKPGITVEQAQARLTTMANSLRTDFASDYPPNSGWTIAGDKRPDCSLLCHSAVSGSHWLS